MKLLIFGTGLFYKNRKKSFQNEQIVAFSDNDTVKWQTSMDGVRIIPPSEIKNMEYDYICIMTRNEYAVKIRDQLEKLEVAKEKVIGFSEFQTLILGHSEKDAYAMAVEKFDFSREPGMKLKKELNIVSPNLALITIVTPYYNAGKYFEQTFCSVMNQTFPWFEWLIVDDGSTREDDIRILKSFAERDKRIRVIAIENGGVSNARNIGFRNAKTEIVVPLDADDLISPQYLEYLFFGLYYNYDAAWCYGGGVGFFGMQYLWNKPWDAEKMKTYNSLMVTAAIRKKDWEEAGGYKTEKWSYNEDWRFWLDMLAKHKKPVRIGGYHFWYRRMATGRLAELEKDPERIDFDRKIIRRAAQQADGSVQAIEYPCIQSRFMYQKQKSVDWDSKRILVKKDKKIRMLMIIPWMVMGGADKFNLDLCAGLSSRNYEVSIMTTLSDENDWQYKFAEITDEIFNLPDFLDPTHYLSFVEYYIRSRQVDILFVSNSTTGYYMIPALRKKFPKLCIIDYVHMEEWYWKAGGHARTSGMLGNLVNRTYVCNSATRNVLIQYFGREPQSVKTLYIGVDEEQFDRNKIADGYLYEKLGIKEKRPIILFPCRIHPQKRPLMILKIAEKMRVIHPEALFAVVGDGPLLGELKCEIAKRKLQQTVKCVGRCDDMASCYKDARITLICSLKEGLALTAYESCSMGVPVISSAVGGQGDLIDHSVGKLIPMRQTEASSLDSGAFEEEEVQEYVNAICELLEDEERYKACSVNCRNKIEQTFSIKKMLENIDLELQEFLCADTKENERKMQELQDLGYLAEELYTMETVIEAKEYKYNIL